MPTVSMVANQAKIPTICGESGMVENGGPITNGINYFDLGVLTGKQAAEILEGADPATMPIEYCPEDSYTYTVNEDTAAEIGIEIPEEFLQDSEEAETEASTETADRDRNSICCRIITEYTFLEVYMSVLLAIPVPHCPGNALGNACTGRLYHISSSGLCRSDL